MAGVISISPGVAGRVLSNEGPGDIWGPREDGRGVVLVEAYVPEVSDDAVPRSGLNVRGGAIDVLQILILLTLLGIWKASASALLKRR
jgi:glycerophosphoryl diester phosphodiesterase